MLELAGVDAFYGAVQVLHGVSLRVDEGEIVTLVGANGAGKSTTLMTISGVVAARGGEIRFAGRPILGFEPHRIAALGIVQVPEGRRVFPGLTVAENLEMGAYLRRDPDGIAADREEVWGLFPILRERRHQGAGTLSGGEQQMLAIGRALMARPRLLLLDEPSLGLAPLLVKGIFQCIRDLNARHGTTILLVEQNANQALRISRRGYCLENGRVTLSGGGMALLEDPRVRRAYLGLEG
jgi:branched-chain amino acid transport system ATP-binding protein